MTSYGRNIKLSIEGASHDPEITLTVEGLPAGIEVNTESLQSFMDRRAPGRSAVSTARREADIPHFTGGIADGKTDGGLLRAVLYNRDVKSSDYESIRHKPRPSHADYPAYVKYGADVDLRGGGIFSGRLTAPLCIAGGILRDELKRRGIEITAHISMIGGVCDTGYYSFGVYGRYPDVSAKPFPTLDDKAGERMREIILSARERSDSVGGCVECAVTGLPVGVGEHMFCGMEGRISSLLFSIPAVKGVQFGDGFAFASEYGSAANDCYRTDGENVMLTSNHCGGIVGGMTTGAPIIFSVAFKPTPSIGIKQNTVDLETMRNTDIEIKGRHDPCIVPRAVPVVEACAAIAVFDALLDE